ncbi:MAG: hypothetical protein QOH76_1558 [Thermoleophilaceae bacterium]|nr:hypothetical protein [Thermoleophilaceae bacterium]
MSASAPTLWTIGHSNTEVRDLVRDLQAHGIQAVADVRSWPRSRYAPWFDQEALSQTLKDAGIQYVWMGPELGGRPDDPALYQPDGKVRYDLVAETELFRDGVRRLREGMEKMRVVIMCSEENPERCHRRLLVTRVLLGDGVAVRHIRRGGIVENEPGFVVQTGLFGNEELPWTSTASVSQRRLPKVSSPD